MKKIVSIVCAILSLAMILAACGAPAATTPPAAPSSPEAAPTASAAPESTAPAADKTAFPSKKISLCVNSNSGGGTDMAARALGAVTGTYFDQPVVVELVPGGGGIVGMEHVVNSTPDGYTLLISAGAQPTIFPFDAPEAGIPETTFAHEDMEPICMISYDPCIITAHPSTGWKTFADMEAYVKEHPDEVVYSSSGLWAVVHLAMMQTLDATGMQMVHLPMQGGGQATTAQINGDAQVTASPASSIAPYIASGHAIPLAVTSAEPWAGDPSIPTIKSLGYDVDFSSWIGIFAPKGTPQDVKDYLEEKFRQCSEDESYQSLVGKMGSTIEFLGQKEFAEKFKNDIEVNKKLIDKLS